MASDTESGGEYEIQEILGERKTGRSAPEYLIRWKGYGPDEDSWVSSKRLVGAREALKLFRNKLKTPKTTKRRSTSRSTSRSRSRSRGRARGSSRSPARQKKASPGRPSTRSSRKETTSMSRTGNTEEVKTEVVKEEPGRYERTTEVITTTVSKPNEIASTSLYQKRVETINTTTKKDPEVSQLKRWLNCGCTPMQWLRNCCQTVCDLDAAVLLAFIIVTIVVISFSMEAYVDFGKIWESFVGMLTALWAWLTSLVSGSADSKKE